MEGQKIIYLFRDPIDVLFSYWPYLQSIPYENFECPKHKNIISFAKEEYWGMDGIINFMNLQLDHHNKHGEVCPAGWTQGKTGMKPSDDGMRDYLANNADEL